MGALGGLVGDILQEPDEVVLATRQMALGRFLHRLRRGQIDVGRFAAPVRGTATAAVDHVAYRFEIRGGVRAADDGGIHFLLFRFVVDNDQAGVGREAMTAVNSAFRMDAGAGK